MDADADADAARIARTAAAIAPPDAAAAARAQERQARLTKPPGSLGRLEALATRIAGITGRERPRLERRLVVVAAGDHGVARQGVSAYPQQVTTQMVANFVAGGAAVSVLADHAGARVRVVDAGVAGETPVHDGLLRLRLGPGTDDITRGPAMPRALAERAIAAGIALLEDERTDGGVDIVGCGEMGIANSTSAAAIVAAVTARPPRSVTGRGTGIDDERFEAKVAAVERALAANERALRAPRTASSCWPRWAASRSECWRGLPGGRGGARAGGGGRPDLGRGGAGGGSDRARGAPVHARLAPLGRAGARGGAGVAGAGAGAGPRPAPGRRHRRRARHHALRGRLRLLDEMATFEDAGRGRV